MIVASEGLKTYVKFQMSIDELATKLNISRMSLYNILDGQSVSGKLISALLKETGFSFEKAFDLVEDKKDRVKK